MRPQSDPHVGDGGVHELLERVWAEIEALPASAMSPGDIVAAVAEIIDRHDPLVRPHSRVRMRATHSYAFRSGEWADITGIRWDNGRPCFAIAFADGKTDSWLIYDPDAGYEFRGDK